MCSRLAQHSVVNWVIGTEEISSSSIIFLKLSFKREVGFYVLQVYIPLTIIVSCSFISFWIVRDVTARSYLLGQTNSSCNLCRTNYSGSCSLAVITTGLRGEARPDTSSTTALGTNR